ncbi:MAG: hypothetical protein KKA54_16735, partial [Proteobacteria bacterium]|nr:hypothetical protein [Pseudomonadota bacterium]
MKTLIDALSVLLKSQTRYLPAVIIICLFSLPLTGLGSNLLAQETEPQETPLSPTPTVEIESPVPTVSLDSLYGYLDQEMDRLTDGTVVYDEYDTGAAGFYP